MRYWIPAAIIVAALPAMASAQTAPELKGPYYELGNGPNGATLVAMGTRQRYGERADITRIVVLPKERVVGEMHVWRIDGLVQFDCPTKTTRTLVMAPRDAKAAVLRLIQPEPEFAPLKASDPTAIPTMAAACDGKLPAGAKPITDLDAWQRQYWAKSGAQ